jgi:hypothetical protein
VKPADKVIPAVYHLVVDAQVTISTIVQIDVAALLGLIQIQQLQLGNASGCRW